MTERMKAQTLIRQSEVKYRELVESASSIILKMDMEGNITFFNEFALQFFGFTLEEVIGHSVVGTIVPSEESGGRNLKAILHDICTHPEQYEKNENENICKDGRRVWVSWTNKVITPRPRPKTSTEPRPCNGWDFKKSACRSAWRASCPR